MIMKSKAAILTFCLKSVWRKYIHYFACFENEHFHVFSSTVLRKKEEAYQIMALLAKNPRLDLNNTAMFFSPEMIH